MRYINRKLSEWDEEIKTSYKKAMSSGDVYTLTSDLDCCQAMRSHIRFALQNAISRLEDKL